MTADGALGHEAKTFMHHLADKIVAIWHKSHSEVLGYVNLCACKDAFCCPSCYKSVYSWQLSEMENGD